MARGRTGLIGSILEKVGRMLQGGAGRRGSRGRRSGKGGMLRRLLS